MKAFEIYQKINFPRRAIYHSQRTRSTTPPSMLAQRILTHSVPYATYIVNYVHHPETGKRESLDSLLQGDDCKTWITPLSKNLDV